ncbi:MAG: hypothetical protein PHC38_04260 [Weeksellaceae bacterium]|nr:hypothetical protein [Weeksellaceae bacterium]
MSVNLVNKKILLFVPGGRGIYGTAVAAELEERGATVAVFDERPSQKTFTKIAFRLAKKQLKAFFLNYLTSIIKQNKHIAFDYILIIRAEAFTPAAMKLLKETYPNAKTILYLWDSVNNTNTAELFPIFDRILSFDRFDVEKYNLIHRPLFFINDYRKIALHAEVTKDVLFIGKVHSDRYAFLSLMEQILNKNNFSTYFYLYLPSSLLYYQMKLQNADFKKAKKKDFHFKMMPAAQAALLLGQSRASLDAQHPAQTGLTMRTLEVFGAKRKLITTNQDIKHYDLYDEQNILVVNRKNPKIDLEFIRSPYKEVSFQVYERYSLQGWTNDLFYNL